MVSSTSEHSLYSCLLLLQGRRLQGRFSTRDVTPVRSTTNTDMDSDGNLERFQPKHKGENVLEGEIGIVLSPFSLPGRTSRSDRTGGHWTIGICQA